MTGAVTIARAGQGMTVQDLGRPGYTAFGISQGGAMDRLALVEAAALLGLPGVVAAVEMAGAGGEFTVDEPTRFALTGAPMRATVEGAPARWHASHVLQAGERLSIGSATAGNYGYLTFAGGFANPERLGSRATHLAAGLGQPLAAGESLPLLPDPKREMTGRTFTPEDRFAGGTVRLMPGPQTALFAAETFARFCATGFARNPRSNRQGIKLDGGEAPFAPEETKGLASDFIVPGDVQMTGDGIPFVLMAECQTTGGYPRIGSVVPADLPRVAQAPVGAVLRFVPVSLEEAERTHRAEAEILRALRGAVRPLVRDPHDIGDLLAYQLISGVTPGDDLERA